MNYKLINKQTGEEHICQKMVVDGFDYYVSDEQITLSDTLKTCYYIFNNVLYKREYNHHKGCKKVIATNNPNIDVPKVENEVEYLALSYEMSFTDDDGTTIVDFIEGYNKSQETHPFSEEDMLDFAECCEINYSYNQKRKHWYKYTDKTDDIRPYTTKELLQLWKEQQLKIVYYED